ncbi:hypothetical protein GOODEAATRI_020511, partial [Goodea atripinnis]
MMRRQAALALKYAIAQRIQNNNSPTNTHTEAVPPHLRNVTGLLLRCKPMGALNKHLFLPVNPPVSGCCLHGSPKAQHPLVSSPFLPLLISTLLYGDVSLPSKGIYTLTFRIQIKKCGQGEAERITEAYECDSCF